MLGRTNTGGGGGGLNFRVIGSTSQPTFAKENDIWVNTDKIESYVFSAIEPESPVAGMVWFEVGPDSSVAFNMLRKNAVYIYPVSCKQYVGEEWTNVEAHIHQGGEWVLFSEFVTDIDLFNMGDTCDKVTGGWGTTDGGAVTESKLNVSCYYNHSGAQVFSKNSVDLSKYKTLHVLCESFYTESYFGIMSKAPSNASGGYDTSYGQCTARGTISAASKEFTLDISSHSGNYYIWLGNTGGGSSQNYGCTVSKVWLTL